MALMVALMASSTTFCRLCSSMYAAAACSTQTQGRSGSRVGGKGYGAPYAWWKCAWVHSLVRVAPPASARNAHIKALLDERGWSIARGKVVWSAAGLRKEGQQAAGCSGCGRHQLVHIAGKEIDVASHAPWHDSCPLMGTWLQR